MKLKTRLKNAYNKAKSAKVGDEVVCPSCGTKFTKRHYQEKFCKTRGGTSCKDYYWNNVTETKRNNKTRISPASAAYQLSRGDGLSVHDIYDTFHPYEGLNDDDYKNH